MVTLIASKPAPRLKTLLLALGLLGTALWPATGRAVSITGKIGGAVVDPTGLPVEGATVVTQSPNLIGKNRTTRTGPDGEFKFQDLAPGTYSVTVTAEGFRETRQEGITVSLGLATQVDVVMEPPVAATQEAYVVTARPSVVDTEQTHLGQTLNQSFTGRINTDRDYQGLAMLVPGSQDSPKDQAPGNPVIHGANPYSNQYLLDGINITDPSSNTFANNFNFDAIEDVEILTGGRDPEYGGATGGVVNVVTKSGGNKFTADASIYYSPDMAPLLQHKILSADSRLFPEGIGPYRRADKVRHFQSGHLNLNLGGPIIEDKLWFFVSGQMGYNQSSIDQRNFPGAGLAPREFRSFYGLAKLTWQPVSWQRFQLMVQGDPSTIDNTSQLPAVHPDAETNQKQGAGIVLLSSDTNLGEHVLFKNKVGFFSNYIQTTPQSGNFELPGRSNASTGTSTVNETRLYRDTRNRFQFSPQLVISWDKVLGSHETKLGADAMVSWQNVYDSIPGGRWYSDTGIPADPNQPGTPDFEQRLIKPQNGLVSGDTLGLYVQDSWKPFRSLTIRPGLRFDSSRMRNDHGSPSSLQQANKDGGASKVFQEFFDSTIVQLNVTSPRLGFAWDPFSDGKTNIHGGYYRYADTSYLMFPQTVGRSTQTRRYNYNAATGKYDTPAGDSGGESGFKVKSELSGFNPAHLPNSKDVDLSQPWSPKVQGWAPLQFITGDHAPKTDEFILGVTRELVESVSLSVDGIFRYYSNLYEDTETNLIWNKDGSNVVDGRNGTKDVVYSLGTPNSAMQIYYGVDVSLRKYLTDRFEGMVNYTFGVNRGTTDQPFSVAFDREKQFPYLFGFMNTDRRHILRFMGYYHLPLGFVAGGTFSYLSGQPLNKLYRNEFFGDYTDFRASRGYDPDHPGHELRLPDTVNSDVRLTWDAYELTGQKIWLITDVSNVLNLRTPIDIENRNLPAGSPTQYGDVLQRQSPVQFTFGMRFQY